MELTRLQHVAQGQTKYTYTLWNAAYAAAAEVPQSSIQADLLKSTELFKMLPSH